MENLKKSCGFLVFLLFSFLSYSQHLDSLLDTGKQLLIEKKYDEALLYYDAALELAEYSGDVEISGNIYNNLGIIYKGLGNYSLSIENYNRSIEVRRSLGLDSLAAGTLFNMALVLKKSTFYDIALEHFQEALQIYRRFNNDEMEAKTLDAVGNIYYELDNYEESHHYHALALEIYQKSNNTVGLGEVFHNMAELYIEVDSLDKAAYCIQQSWEYKKANDKSNQQNEMLKGELLLKKNKWDSSAYYFHKVLNERRAKNNPNRLISAYYHLGHLYYESADYLISKQFLDSAYTLATNVEDFQMQMEIIAMQVDVLEKEERHYEMIEKYKLLLELNKTYMGARSHNMVAYFNSQYAFLKNQKALEIAQSKNELKTVENKNLTFKFRLVMSLVILFLLLTVFIFFLSLRVKRKNKLLNLRNKTIESLHSELNHRTKNYYQMLNGMLLYDSDVEENPAVVAMLRRYIARVDAMAQIQHYLVLADDKSTAKVNLKRRLSDLIDEIDLALNNFEPKVQITKELADFELDYNRTCYVSIALNELLQNAFKHSFENCAQPKIEIGLKVGATAFTLLVRDNGVGFSANDKSKKGANGLLLLNQLVAKIKGELIYISPNNGGLEVQLNVPINK